MFCIFSPKGLFLHLVWWISIRRLFEIFDWFFFKFHLNCRVASGSRTAHDPAGWGHHHKDRRWLEETEHAVPLSGTLLVVYRKMQLDPALNLLCSSDLIVTNVCFFGVCRWCGTPMYMWKSKFCKVLQHIAQRMVSAETLNLIISGL